MSQAGHAVQAIKPVFMMSPLSVAKFLPPGALRFDLVVFDEASQVEPVDALRRDRARPAGGRGRRQQAAPADQLLRRADRRRTSRRTTTDCRPPISRASSACSRRQGCPQRMLRWHYRSRHESLIAVSNREFYENQPGHLPQPGRPARAAGPASSTTLPDAVYDRGGTAHQPGEARAVAEAVMQHARSASPELIARRRVASRCPDARRSWTSWRLCAAPTRPARRSSPRTRTSRSSSRTWRTSRATSAT